MKKRGVSSGDEKKPLGGQQQQFLFNQFVNSKKQRRLESNDGSLDRSGFERQDTPRAKEVGLIKALISECF